MKLYNVLDYGVNATPETNNANLINQLISDIAEYSTIYFPTGEYLILESILVNKRISFIGDGFNSRLVRDKIFDQGSIFSFNLPYEDSSPTNSSQISNLLLGSNFEKTSEHLESHGIFIHRAVNLFLNNIAITNQPGSGVEFSNEFLNNTIEINNSYIRLCNKHGVNISSYSSDIHIENCDIGLNRLSNILLEGVSSTVKNSTIWGSKEDCGILLRGPSNHISLCQIEGNFRHAMYLIGSDHCSINSCKIYASISTGSYGIYIASNPDKEIENIFINGNMIYSSLSDSYSSFEDAIFIDNHHKNFKVFNNNMSYLGIGEIVTDKRPYVKGLSLKNGDLWNNIDDYLFFKGGFLSTLYILDNTPTPIYFSKIEIDLSNICKDKQIYIREDGTYNLSGYLSISSEQNPIVKISINKNNKMDELIYYGTYNKQEQISLNFNWLSYEGEVISLYITTSGGEIAIFNNSTIKITKLN